jgi:nicotinate-nucleotide adenylyltransferase
LGEAKTYSIDTIEKVRSGLTPEDELYFLVGQDAFDELAVWHRLADVVDQVEFIVASRPHSVSSVRREGVAARARFQRLEGVDVSVSATAVRQLTRQGMDIRDLVPDAVADYIRRHELYRKNKGGRPLGRPPFCL